MYQTVKATVLHRVKYYSFFLLLNIIVSKRNKVAHVLTAPVYYPTRENTNLVCVCRHMCLLWQLILYSNDNQKEF